MSASNFSSCRPSNELPDFVNIPSIPRNISTIFVPARGNSYAPMVSCCAPNPVQLVEGCYYWCEFPKAQAGADVNSVSFCLRTRTDANNNTIGETGITISGYHMAGANNVATGWGRVVLWAVAVSAVLNVVSM